MMNFLSCKNTVREKEDIVYISRKGYDALVAKGKMPFDLMGRLLTMYLGNVGAVDAHLTEIIYSRL